MVGVAHLDHRVGAARVIEVRPHVSGRLVLVVEPGAEAGGSHDLRPEPEAGQVDLVGPAVDERSSLQHAAVPQGPQGHSPGGAGGVLALRAPEIEEAQRADVPDGALAEEVADGQGHGREAVAEGGEERGVRFLHGRDHRERALPVGGERLLAQDGKPVARRRQDVLPVEGRGGHDAHHLDPGLEEGLGLGEHPLYPQVLAGAGASCLVGLEDGVELEALGVEDGGDVAALGDDAASHEAELLPHAQRPIASTRRERSSRAVPSRPSASLAASRRPFSVRTKRA